MSDKYFFEKIDRGEIPNEAPIATNLHSFDSSVFMLDKWVARWEARDFCTSRGMWAIVYKAWVKELRIWIGDRSVLEIMGGAGWLAKALYEEGANIICTDDYSWDGSHKNMNRVFDVEKIEALDAIKKYDCDIVMCSWPPHGDETIVRVAEQIPGKVFIYIGEQEHGCNAPVEFMSLFCEDKYQPVKSFMQWPGIHDQVIVGKIRGE
jgi:hypothetical protein